MAWTCPRRWAGVFLGVLLGLGQETAGLGSMPIHGLVDAESPIAPLHRFDAEPKLQSRTEYELRTGVATIAPELPWTTSIAQAYKTTYLSLTSKEAVTWTIDGVLESEEPSIEVAVTFKDLEDHHVSVNGGEQEFTVSSRIVRRELRDLTEGDREKYFNALHELYFLEDAEAEAQYGKEFFSMSKIMRLHLYGAADKACDHWHDDAGMVNHHVGITWKFEQSLRMIDPTTASHYWDYTREAWHGTAWYDSEIFEDDWFGVASPSNEHHILDSGRFAYTPIMKNARSFSAIVNPYGLLRSPWNTNPTPFLMRYNRTAGLLSDGNHQFPSCVAFAESMYKSTLAAMMNAFNGELHGPVHIMIGGHWDVDPIIDAVTAAAEANADDFLLISKFMWRQGLIRTAEYCSEDTPVDKCLAHCPTEITGDVSSDTGAMRIFEDYGIATTSLLFDTAKTVAKKYGMGLGDLLKSYCKMGHPGEMFSSAAPQDPTFWPLHGNIERTLQLARLMKEAKYLHFSEEWRYKHLTGGSDTHLVCDWSGVEGLGMPSCSTGTCPGHRSDDILPFTDMTKDRPGFFTNLEFYGFIRPQNEHMPYVYDSLDHWPACYKGSMMKQYTHSFVDR